MINYLGGWWSKGCCSEMVWWHEQGFSADSTCICKSGWKQQLEQLGAAELQGARGGNRLKSSFYICV
jgi:hypothetical protein